MKYIRTCVGVYALETNAVLEVGDMIPIPNDGICRVSKVANTIEELCDEFVIIGKKKRKVKEITKVIYTLNQLKNNEIYGAIWTDRGLIYVAKMNGKGELELL